MNCSPIPYLQMQTLIAKGSGLVCFAQSPDGLPLLAKVEQLPRAEGLLHQAALALGCEANPPQFTGTPLEPLARELKRLLQDHRIQHLLTPEQTMIGVMLLPILVQHLTGATLLSRLLVSLGSTISSAATNASPGVESEIIPQPKFKFGQSCLALPLQGDQSLIVTKEASANGWPRYSLCRPFLNESITHIPGRYEYEFYQGAILQKEEFDDLDGDRYQALRLQSLNARCTWYVSRNAVARIILELATALETLHQTGKIHGDLKPDNVLITALGVVLIDSLELRTGVRSPAMTKGWAAPEQVIGSPVSIQTDQYPIGLMLLKLLQGVLYGEESRILIPIGGTQLETHTVLKPPLVFIDPETAPVEPEAIPTWCQLIAQCLSFEPRERFSSMAALCETLHSLTEQQTLKGELQVSLDFGNCIIGKSESGEIRPCWLAAGVVRTEETVWW